MTPKEQATQQSIQSLNQINKVVTPAKEATYFKDYWTKGFNLGRFEERNDFFKPVAQFANFLGEQFVEAPLSAPKTISEGATDIQKGKYYSGVGKIGKGAIDLISIVPIAKGAKLATTAPKLGSVIAAGAKEGAAYGGGYGLFEGLIQAQDVKPEDRLGVIAEPTLKGGVGGVALGAGIPAAFGALKKSYKYFFPDNLTQVTKKLDAELAPYIRESQDIRNRPKFGPELPEKTLIETPTIKEPVKKLRAALPIIKKDITEANIQFKQVGRQIIQNAEETASKAGSKIEQVAPAIKNKAADIITNIAAGNKDGAVEIATNLSTDVFGKTKKFLVSLKDKGNLPDQAKLEIDDFIKTSEESRYLPRESRKEFEQVSNEVFNMPLTLVEDTAKSILDIVKRTNQIIYNQTLDPTQRPRLIQEALYKEFPNSLRMYGNVEEFIDALAGRLAAEGNPLSKQLFNASASVRTAAGQTIESAKRSLQGQIDQANEALAILRGAKNNKLSNEINTATDDIANEITNQINTLIDSGATQKELTKFFNESMKKNFGKDWNKKQIKPLRLKELPPDTVARRIEDLAKRIPKDATERKEQQVVDSMINQLYLIAKDKVNAPINPYNPDSVFKTLKTALENKAQYKNTWEKAKQRVMETFKGDEGAYAILQDYFARNVPDVFTESQSQKAYKRLLGEDGLRFNDLIRQHFTSQVEKREDLVLRLQSKLGLSQAEAADLSSKIYSYFNTNLESSRRAAIDRIITPLISSPKQKKEVTDKLIEYTNLGIFDNTEYANAVASKLNLPHLSDDNVKFIAQTMRDVQVGKIDMENALKNIAMDISKTNKFDPLRSPGDFNIFMNSYFYNNIFSSFQTWERNFLGGLVNSFIVRPSIIAGENVAANIFKTIGKELPEGVNALPKGEIGNYYKQLFGSIGNASNRFFEVIKDPNYIARTDNPTVRYYFDKGRENQLPKILTTVGRFMEALDQFNATLIMNAEENLLRSRGFSPEDARQKAFTVSQELLGRATFGKGFQRGDFTSGNWKQKVKEQGWIDPFFDTIGNAGYKLRGSGPISNFATTAIFPVIRIAINLQKLKTKLFLPTQLFNVLAKDPANRKLQDYGFLAASGFTTAYAIDKMTKGEIEFEAPKDEKAKQLFYDSGKKPYSVKIGNSYVPFQYLEVFGAPFLAMGAIKAAFQDNPEALNQNVIDKTSLALRKFAKAYFVSPTYLSTISNIYESLNSINGKDWTQALAYPATGLIPFSGLLRDLSDIYDPIRRQKKGAWDEFKSVFGPLRQDIAPFRDVNLKPVELNASELYAPYGIGTSNPQREEEYNKRINELQQTKFRQEQLKPEKERIDKAKIELEMALRAGNIKYANDIVIKEKLSPAEVSGITNKIKEDQAKSKLSSEELGLYNLTAPQLETLAKQNPELLPLIRKVQSFKNEFVSPLQSTFDTLKNINQEVKPKKQKTGRKKFKAKKVRTKKFKIAKPKKVKVKKLTAIKPVKV